METRLNDKISFINGEGFVKWKMAQRSSLKVYLFFELGLFNLSCSCRDEMEDDFGCVENGVRLERKYNLRVTEKLKCR